MAQQTVVETPEFIKRASAVGMSDEDRMDVIDQLAANPEAGISLGGGLGKSGWQGAAAERVEATVFSTSTAHRTCRYSC